MKDDLIKAVSEETGVDVLTINLIFDSVVSYTKNHAGDLLSQFNIPTSLQPLVLKFLGGKK